MYILPMATWETPSAEPSGFIGKHGTFKVKSNHLTFGCSVTPTLDLNLKSFLISGHWLCYPPHTHTSLRALKSITSVSLPNFTLTCRNTAILPFSATTQSLLWLLHPHLNTSLPSVQYFSEEVWTLHTSHTEMVINIRDDFQSGNHKVGRFFVLILLNSFLAQTELSAPSPTLFLTHLPVSRINQFLDILYTPEVGPQLLLALESSQCGSWFSVLFSISPLIQSCYGS